MDGRKSTGGSLYVTVVDSVVSNNFVGVERISAAGAAATAAMVRNSVASYNNNIGLVVGAHSVVTGNKTGVGQVRGAPRFSYGDNDIDGNQGNNTGVLTPLAMH